VPQNGRCFFIGQCVQGIIEFGFCFLFRKGSFGLLYQDYVLAHGCAENCVNPKAGAHVFLSICRNTFAVKDGRED
jgi:hypothetical protein